MLSIVFRPLIKSHRVLIRSVACCVLLAGLPAIAQPKAGDSLEQVLQKAGTDTAKARILFEAGDLLSVKDSARAFHYIRRGLQVAVGDPFTQGLGHFYLGRAYMDYDYELSDQDFAKAIELITPLKNPQSYILQARAWSNRAILKQYDNDNAAYIDILLHKVIPLSEKAGDQVKLAEYYALVGVPFMSTGNHKKAIYYFLKSNELIRAATSRQDHLIGNYINIAKTYNLSKKPELARQYLDSAYRLLEQFPDYKYKADYFIAESIYYIDQHQEAAAIRSLDKGLSLVRAHQDLIGIRDLLYQKARIYDLQRDYAAAKATVEELLTTGYLLTDQDRKQLYHDLSYLNENLGNTGEAYRWLQRYAALADSIAASNNSVAFARLEAKYNYEKKESELLLARNREKTQRMLMWISFGVLLLALLAFVYLNRLRKARAAAQVRSLKQQQQIALTEALLQGEEKERARLARDLHDGLGGMLAGVKINLSNALQDKMTPATEKSVAQLDQAITELRRIAHNLMPETLLRSGIETALADLCQTLSHDQLKIEHHFIAIDSRQIPGQVQVIIFRIVQELLTNIVKHAGASEAYLQCSQNGAYFYITVEDNGKGIDQTNYRNSRGIGLSTIQSRVDFLKGKMDFSSVADQGTVTNIEIRTDESR